MTDEELNTLIWKSLVTGQGSDMIRLAFVVGFNHGLIKGQEFDTDEYREKLKTMYGIDLQAEMVMEGYNEFLKLLPELLKP